ncbi:MAG: twin-arginine translocase subunit TatB [Hyphomonadaceae bacterium]|nr:twin-arginine translocase subunit TatB [Hyphomonadaceae bacterium]
MLPSLGFQEILLLAVLALVVVGPKDLPLMLRKLGRWTARLRAMAQEFRSGFDELARQAELDELKKEVEALRRDRTLTDLQHEITKPAILPGTLPPPPALPEPVPAAADKPLVEEARSEGRVHDTLGEAQAANPSVRTAAE